MLKATILSGFIIATTAGVQKGYEMLLSSLDTYVDNSYGVLADSRDLHLQDEGKEITDNYYKKRSNY